MRILVTGVAGFIGFHLARQLLRAGHQVTGIDSMTSYYDIGLKKDRLALLQKENVKNFNFETLDLVDADRLHALFIQGQFTHVLHMAAQAGVRFSLTHPASYIQSNIVGFANVLEECRLAPVEHLVFASSSSVYGMNEKLPYSPHQSADHPESLYAATKKSNENMAHAYSHLWNLPITGLRFFTVYGPWGRPDMAAYLFTEAILNHRPIKLFNNGDLQRDFTYVDDIVSGVASIMAKPPLGNPDFDPACPDPASSSAPWRIYNIGNSQPAQLHEFVATLENIIGKKALIEKMPMQPGDVKRTWADISDFAKISGFMPRTSLKQGLENYVRWHKDYYGYK